MELQGRNIKRGVLDYQSCVVLLKHGCTGWKSDHQIALFSKERGGLVVAGENGYTPLLIYLYDVLLVSDSWREPLRKRTGFYAALASTWLLLDPAAVRAP